MELDVLKALDSAILDVEAGIRRQRDFIDDFSARGYDMRSALSLLASLLVNLHRLERQRRDLAVSVQDVVVV